MTCATFSSLTTGLRPMPEAPKRIWRNELGFCFDDEAEAIDEGPDYAAYVLKSEADRLAEAMTSALSRMHTNTMMTRETIPIEEVGLLIDVGSILREALNAYALNAYESNQGEDDASDITT